jgi:hypothetical protein
MKTEYLIYGGIGLAAVAALAWYANDQRTTADQLAGTVVKLQKNIQSPNDKFASADIASAQAKEQAWQDINGFV